MSAYLCDNKGNEVASVEEVKIEKEMEVSFNINNINLWSAENPYLYNLFIKVLDDNKELIEIIPQKVGFRKFELVNGIMKLNGKRIVFKGINRHEFNAEHGRSLTKEDISSIVILMCKDLKNRLKDLDINLEMKQDAIDLIAKDGIDLEYGARPLKRSIQNNLENELSELILQQVIKAGDDVVADVKDDKMIFTVQ